MKKRIIISGIILCILIVVCLYYATVSMPDSPVYPLKRLEEKAMFKLGSSRSKQISYNEMLLNRRFQELQYVLSLREYPLFLSSSLRYSTTAGDITDMIISDKDVAEAKNALHIFAKQRGELKHFVAKKDTQNDWKFIQDSANYLTIYSNKLSNFLIH